MSRDEAPGSANPWVRAALVGLLALLVLHWLADRYEAVRSGRFAQPVNVSVEGPSAPVALEVKRESLRGNDEGLARVPGRNEWQSGHEWFRGLSVTGPQSAWADVGAVRVRIGSREFRFGAEELRRSSGPVPGAEPPLIRFRAPPEVRAERSMVARFDAARNWPGDGNAATHLVFDVLTWRIAVALAIAWMLREHARRDEAGRRRLVSIARGGTLAVLAGFVAVVLAPVLWSRVSAQLSVEHLEGVQAACTWIWTNQDGDLYSLPTIDACGNIYSPGYYVASRLWGAVFGLSLPSLRSLTWVCNLVSAVAASYVIRRLGQGGRAWTWVPLYLATFCYYRWIDNANKDALHVALSMAGFALLVRCVGPGSSGGGWTAVGAGVAWAAAFMTKQSHLVVTLPVLAVLAFGARRTLWTSGASFLVSVALMTAASLREWPHYWEWTVTIPGAHRFHWPQLGWSLADATCAFAGYGAVATAWWLERVRAPAEGHGDERPAGSRTLAHLCLAFAVGGLAMGCMSAGKDRGGTYALAPGLAALCIPVAASFGALRTGRSAMAIPLLLLVLGWPGGASVGEREARNASRLVELVRRESGDVWVPLEPFANAAAGRRTFAPVFCLGEWTAAGRALPDAVLDPIRDARFSAIVTQFNPPERGGARLDSEPFRTIADRYEVAEVIPADDAYSARDGWRNSLRLVWRPRAR